MGIRRALARGAQAVGNRVSASIPTAVLGGGAGALYGAWPRGQSLDAQGSETLEDALGGALIGASLPHLSRRYVLAMAEDLASKDARYQAKVMTEIMRAARARGDDAVPHADGYGMRDYAEREGGGGFGEWMNERSDLVDDLLPDQRVFDDMAREADMVPPRMRDLIDEARRGSYLENSNIRLGDWRVGGQSEGAPLLAIPVAVGASGVLGALDKRKRKTSASS